MLDQYLCQQCGKQLAEYQFKQSPYCHQAKCQQAKVKHHLQALEELSLDAKQKAAKFINTHSNIKNKKGLDSAVSIILPSNKNKLAKANFDQQAQFLAYLERIYISIENSKDKVSEDDLADFPYSTMDELDSEEPNDRHENLLGKACRTCKGHCCGTGGTTAYQDKKSLLYYFEKIRKELTKAELLERYKHYLPTQSYQNACVYQGEHGCTLPPVMRSLTCHRYTSTALEDYKQKLGQNNKQYTLAIAAEHYQTKHISLYNHEDYIELTL